ncbi:MAG: inositol monophosphatase [Elusimicrobiales bacterium]|nr:inositol monophosphatase [Elusimicrobiales bacterium]
MIEAKLAVEAAEKAGKEIMDYLGNTYYRLKSRANPVTEADIISQEIITSMILKKFPKHSVISEENYTKVKNFNNLWIIDPLDGTVNFSHSFKHFAISIAYVFEGSVIVGVIYDPCKNELFVAEKDRGSFLNNRRIYVSKINKLSESLLATGFAYDRAKKADFYCSFYSEFMKKSHDVRRCGAASLDMAYVACGRIDGYWEFNLKSWDVAAGKVIVEEAGGMISDFSGKMWNRDFDSIMEWGRETLVTNYLLHSQMLSILKKVFKRYSLKN